MIRSAFCGKVGSAHLDAFWAAKRGMPQDSPLIVRHSGGKVLRDFVWAATGVPMIADHVIHILQSASISGWSTYSIRILDQSDQDIQGFSGLGVTGRCAWVGFDKREEALVWRANPGGGQSPFFSGLRFPRDSWDGSDIFVGDDLNAGGAWIVVTNKVHELFRLHKITNCELEPLEEVELLAQSSAIIRTRN